VSLANIRRETKPVLEGKMMEDSPHNACLHNPRMPGCVEEESHDTVAGFDERLETAYIVVTYKPGLGTFVADFKWQASNHP